MTLKVYPCTELANKILENCAEKAQLFENKFHRKPTLAVILVGSDPASMIYVQKKSETCKKFHVRPIDVTLPHETSQKTLEAEIQKLNTDATVDGILVQSPLPSTINEKFIHSILNPEKDVDCFHPQNVGALTLDATRSLQKGMVPCTPAGVMEVLKANAIALKGKKAVVIGRSNIVGKPMFLLLQAANATVTACNSHTENLAEVCSGADIIVSAIGKPQFIKKNFIKKNAVLIDVGINRIELNGKKKIVGDFDFSSIEESQASFITPVPRGIGPMTIAMLLRNTVRAAWLREKQDSPI